MSFADLQLRDTQGLVDEVAHQLAITPGSVTLVVVDEPATRQRILAVRRLDVSAAPHDELELSKLLHDEMQTLPIPPWSREQHTVVVTVIGRTGFNVWSSVESTWAMGWRYSNHLTGASDGEIVVVTEHGWAAMFTHEGGGTPALAASA
jgi:hypothetical protein